MTDYELEKINAERRRKGLPPLDRRQAQNAVSSNPSSSDSGFDMMHFLIGYTTGIPMPSAAGIMGAVLHPQPTSSYPDVNDAAHATPSYSAPDPSPSYSSSSSSDSSSSSSSYDSGSSSSSSSSDSGSW